MLVTHVLFNLLTIAGFNFPNSGKIYVICENLFTEGAKFISFPMELLFLHPHPKTFLFSVELRV